MESRVFAAKKIKIKNLPKIETNIYSMIALNNLVVYAVNFLQEQGVTATIEEIVSICFRLFPQSFALKNYPRWPDSALVIRRLNDGREKGNLKGNSMDGFSLKYKGKQLAKRVARALGLVQPASTPVKIKKKTVPVKKKAAAIAPVKAQGMNTQIISQKKKSIAPAVKKKSLKKQLSKPVKKIVPKSNQPVKQAINAKPVKEKQASPPLIKDEQKPRKKPVKLLAPVPVEKTPIKKKSRKQKNIKIAQSEQLTMALPVIQEKKVKPAEPVTQKQKKTEPQPVKNKSARIKKIVKAGKGIAPAAASYVSKEEKAKAGKVIRLMESSDAFRQYKKNGSKSKISEFDFRSLLLCTMESSPETLARNVNLFKNYASIHNRLDLITFLIFCEGNFASLLKPQAKQPVKKLKR